MPMRRLYSLTFLLTLGCSTQPERVPTNTQDMQHTTDMTVTSHVDMMRAEDASPDLATLDMTENPEMSPTTQEDMSEEMTPSSQERLLTWFQTYNQGLGTDYLTQHHDTFTDGDPRYNTDNTHTFLQQVAYGPHTRNVLDAWLIESPNPTPVAIFIHGGGFHQGDKDTIHNSSATIPFLLKSGISVISISYRYAYRDPVRAIESTTPDDEGSVHDENGTRVDYILRDCARAVQFVRYHAEDWNINPDKIAAFGTSAGAGCAMWVGMVDDLAQPDHSDPVLQHSSRVAVVGHLTSQPTYNLLRWPELLMMSTEFLFDLLADDFQALTQHTLNDMSSTPEGQELSWVLDFYAHMNPGDPPFFTANTQDDIPEEASPDTNVVIHHPRGHVALYTRCKAQDMNCDIETQIESSNYQGNALQYLAEKLLQ